MSSSLEELRSKLDEWNRIFFEDLQKRRIVVEKLQKEKTPRSHYPHYDPQREWKLFHDLQESLLQLSDLELLAYSLLIESHASSFSSSSHSPDKYPAWSHKIHFQHPQEFTSPMENLLSSVNPLLLMVTRPKFWWDIKNEKKGNLKEEFAEIFQSMLR